MEAVRDEDINTNDQTVDSKENVGKDHTVEASAQQVFDEMPERLINQFAEIPTAIPSEIMITATSEIVEEGNGVAETRASNSNISAEIVFGGTTEVSSIGSGADQMFDEMSEQINSLNVAAAAADAASTILAQDISVVQQVFDGMSEAAVATVPIESMQKAQTPEEQDVFDGMSEGEVSEDEEDDDYDEEEHTPRPFAGSEEDDEEEEEGKSSSKRKRKPLSSFIPEIDEAMGGLESLVATPNATFKKSKKKKERVSTKSSARKGKKKSKLNSNNGASVEDKVFITPVARFPDRSDDSADMTICLSKTYKAEKVELSEDRLSAGSSKGYRMVRATRGVVEGAWYFEIKILKLGETGHTRLGWSMEKGDLQAPVGYDANSFGYRDIDGSKLHKATREKYGETGYVEGDTIGFYINLPDGCKYAPKPPQYVWYKGQKYMCAADGKEEMPKVVPGSEICFFKNGVCQGVAFKDLYGGRYYPAASMYTLPNQPNCMVEFNFGPDFGCFPQDFDTRPLPLPMIEVPYVGFDDEAENGVSDEKKC